MYKFILSSVPHFSNSSQMKMNQNFMVNLLVFAVMLLALNLHFIVYSMLIYTHCISTVEVFCFNIFGLGHLIKLMHVYKQKNLHQMSSGNCMCVLLDLQGAYSCPASERVTLHLP